MPRFQSRLFNWIDHSLPAQWGRKTRRLLDRALAQQLPQDLKELPRLLAYQTAKAALYPVYLLSKATKQTFPALLRSRQESTETSKSLSQPQPQLSLDAGTDLETHGITDLPSDRDDPEVDYTNIPLVWRPLAKFLNWIDRTKSQLDRQISTLVKRPSQDLFNSSQQNPHWNQTDLEARLIANQVFAEIWQQEIAARRNANGLSNTGQSNLNGEPSNLDNLSNDLSNSSDPKGNLAQKFPLGKNLKIEALRRLIAAAIAYFFGANPPPQAQPQITENSQTTPNLQGDTELPSLPNAPKSRKVKSHQSLHRVRKGSIQQPDPSETSPFLDHDQSLVNDSTDRLARLKALISAAIDYFIGKRSLTDGSESASLNDPLSAEIEDINEKLQSAADTELEQLAGKDFEQKSIKGIVNKIIEAAKQSVANSVANLERRSSENLSDQSQQNIENLQVDNLQIDLQIDDRLERLQRLIEKAVDYFFSKRRSPALEETADIAPSSESWLTMEDVFGGDDGPWPLPLEYESLAFTRSTEYILQNRQLNSSGELQNSETTTTQIHQHWEEDALIFESSFDITTEDTSERPLRAWIEAQASVLGYAYNPVMRVVFWVDAIVLRLENLAIAIVNRCIKIMQTCWRYLFRRRFPKE
ncbi:MAG: hypothetical protein NW214_04720 [Pseudanabaenaceae cyanobacterium bins.39]|nr:hypothetical protein [Pseudanabaenaceae cyanobacterium bins.39]